MAGAVQYMRDAGAQVYDGTTGVQVTAALFI